MNIITIPKKIVKGEKLVAIPCKEYEELLRISKKKAGVQFNFDKDLNKIIKDVKRDKIVGPFSSVQKLKKSLEK
ncbi:MAG: hypothetical protein AAB772_01865 [Patescibacteria group bacterium]